MTKAMEFGVQMWTMLDQTFHESAEANGYDGHPEKAQLWAGFLAAAGGAMAADIGPVNARAIIDTVSLSCVEIAKDELRVVKP